MGAGDVGGLDELELRLEQLMQNTDAAGRVRLAHQIGRELRRSQARRIRGNRNPDGSAYEPRKPREPLRAKAGRIKGRAKRGPMFRKMGSAAYLSWEASPDGVDVGFADSALARIARVHQFGLRDRVTRRSGGPEADYPARGLLGLTGDERGRILDLVLARLRG